MQNKPCQDKNQNHLYQLAQLPESEKTGYSKLVMFCQYCGDILPLEIGENDSVGESQGL